MNNLSNNYSKHTCKFCGAERKLIETLIDDEFVWNEQEKRYEPNGFTDNFELTGSETDQIQLQSHWLLGAKIQTE